MSVWYKPSTWGDKKNKDKKENNNNKLTKKELEQIESINWQTTNNAEKSRAEQIQDDIENHMRNMVKDKEVLKKNNAQRLSEFEQKIKEIKENYNQVEKENRLRFEREIEKVKIEKEKQIRLQKTEWQEGQRIKHQMLLVWDYWKREVEILRLENKIRAGVLPTERELIMRSVLELNEYNKTIERGFKDRKIDPAVIEDLNKKLGTEFASVDEFDSDKDNEE